VVRSWSIVAVLGLSVLVLSAHASEADALAISAAIQARHLPFGTILDPIFASPSSNNIVDYTRCGDSALWTGAYLAAESFRYNVTRSGDALNNVKSALAGLTSLVDVTGDNRLARCIVLASSPYAASIASQEAANTVHQAPPWIWLDNTSRDELVGAFFGLGVAFDMVDDPSVKSGIGNLASLLMGYVAHHDWSPNDDVSNTFLLRPEELQSMLDITHHVNPSDGVSGPLLMLPMDAAVIYDTLSNDSYFKFNLDYMSLYHLVLLQDNSDNRNAYSIVRGYTATHQNAFFDIIDRAVNGPNAARDAETQTLLSQWLERRRRDPYVDDSKVVAVCGSEACQPVPVPIRPTTDFLWQRDPFQLAGGGAGTIEGAAIDYLLPYWMARYYGVIAGSAIQSAAAPVSTVAPGSIASMYGANHAGGTAQASSQPLPLTLGGVTVTVIDGTGAEQPAPLLYVSPAQINFIVPEGTAAGGAKFVVSSSAAVQTIGGNVANVAPTLFSANGTGSGVAAATAIAKQASGNGLQSSVTVYQCSAATGCAAVPIQLGVDTPTYLTLYGTGIRNRSALENAEVTIGGMSVPVQYAGPVPNLAGLDQVNVALPLSLRGSGVDMVMVKVDGQISNVVSIDIE